MKKYILVAALLPLSLTAMASDFAGAYLGANLGNNTSTATNQSDRSQIYLGGKAGYNWDLNGFVLGAEGNLDWHKRSYSFRDVGLDARIGYLNNRWLPYARLGVMATYPGTRPHMGLGVEYNLNEHWTMNAEWATDSKNTHTSTIKNSNLVIGLNYKFGDVRAKAASVNDGTAKKAEVAPASGTHR